MHGVYKRPRVFYSNRKPQIENKAKKMLPVYCIVAILLWTDTSMARSMRSTDENQVTLGQVKLLLADEVKAADESQVRFELYTRHDPDFYRELKVDRDDLLFASQFDANQQTAIVIHGFTETTTGNEWMHAVKRGLLSKESYNVILVDWEPLAQAPRYDLAAANTEFVGSLLGKLLNYLARKTGLARDNVYLIGFSLGAQVAGVCANNFRPKRITGLDPAQPLFGSAELFERLDAKDADLVDVLHTNGGNLLSGHLGFYEPVGHVDFYPNNGHDQTGCPNLIFDSIGNVLWNLNLSAIDACSHGRAPEYFIESLRSPNLIGYDCASMEDLQAGLCLNTSANYAGFNADPSQQGSFFFSTLSSSPYAVDHFNLVLYLGEYDRTAHGDLDLLVQYGDISYRAEFSNGWDGLTQGAQLTSYMEVPAASLETGNGLSLTAVWDKNAAYIFGNVDDLPVAAIEALSPANDKRYCLGKNLLLPHKQPVELGNIQNGPCY